MKCLSFLATKTRIVDSQRLNVCIFRYTHVLFFFYTYNIMTHIHVYNHVSYAYVNMFDPRHFPEITGTLVGNLQNTFSFDDF